VNYRSFGLTVLSLQILTSFAFAAKPKPAQALEETAPALILTGYYKSVSEGGNSNQKGHELFIREVNTNGQTTYYAMFVWSAAFASIYEVQASERGELSFYPLTQSENFQFGVHNRTLIYTASQNIDRKPRKFKIEINSQAKNFTQNVDCTIAPIMQYMGSYPAWGNVSTLATDTVLSAGGKRNRDKALTVEEGASVRPKREFSLNVTRSTEDANTYFIKSSNLWFESMSPKDFTNKQTGELQKATAYRAPDKTQGTVEQHPGLLFAREKTGDSLTGLGGDIGSSISYIIAPIINQRNETLRLQAIHYPAGSNECGYVTLGVKGK
jgi:hypothetical protein